MDSLIMPKKNEDSELVVLTCGRSQTTPVHAIGPQVIDYFLLHYVIDGKGVYTCGRQNYTLTAGHCFVILPNELYAYKSDAADPWTYGWIGCKGAVMRQVMESLGVSSQYPILYVGENDALLSAMERIEQSCMKFDFKSELETSAYTMLFLSQLIALSTDREKPLNSEFLESRMILERGIKWLTAHYHKPITVETLASYLGYHRSHISRLFKKYTGLSTKYYLIQLRMQRAKSLLSTSLGVEEIAFSIGYTDASQFSKQFKQWTGVSPTEYRHNIK